MLSSCCVYFTAILQAGSDYYFHLWHIPGWNIFVFYPIWMSFSDIMLVIQGIVVDAVYSVEQKYFYFIAQWEERVYYQ